MISLNTDKVHYALYTNVGNNMKRALLFLLVLTVTVKVNFAQESITETDRLTATAKVWGFLKYYHPKVASGKFDWDQELFRILPSVNNAQNREEMSQVFLEWIDELGSIKPCRKCDSANDLNYFDKNFNLKWIDNEHLFTPELSEKLKLIENNRHQGQQHYVAYFKGEPKMINFRNEIEYTDFHWQNEALRLLSLFRYWNMVEYFFPAKYQLDTQWSEVLYQMIPRFYKPVSEQDFYFAMAELVAALDDSHAVIYNKSDLCILGCYHPPFEYKIIDDFAVITGFYDHSLAQSDDLRIGDIITKAEGREIQRVFEERSKFIPASNEPRKKLNAGYYLLSGSTKSVSIEGIRNGQAFSKPIKRYRFQEFKDNGKEKSEKFSFIGDSIGYINIGKIETKEVPKVMETFKNTKAIIFDIRKSVASTPYYFANYITSKKREFYKAIYPDLDYPGRYIWSENHQSGNNERKYPGKVILLVDESCQSQMEFTAMCLQTGDDVTTIGRQTSGANGNVIRFKMVGGFQAQMTGIGIFYPNGKEAQRNGVKIDIEVEPSIEAIINERDEILERAIEYTNN